MRKLKDAVGRFFSHLPREEGQALVEYGLIIALIALVVIGVLTTVGTDVSSVFSSIGTSLGGAL